MTAKDYVYLSLILLSAAVFYWTGFYGGFTSTLREIKRREDALASEKDLEVLPEPGLSAPALTMDTLASGARSSRRSIRPAHAPASSSAVGMHGVPFPAAKVYFGRN